MPGAKRKRSNAGTPVVVNVGGGARRMARRAKRYGGRGKWERTTYPASRFFRQYVERNPLSRAAFGASYASATPEQRATRSANRMVGAGAYSVGRNWRRFAQDVGLVPAAKRFVSSGAAALGAGLMGGMGAYSNSLVNDGMGVPDEVPMFQSAMDETGAVTVSRREYIGELVPTNSIFEAHVFDINPGLAGTFKWLSQIACNFEEYDLQQCVFTFNSTMTDIGSSTSGQVGTVIMATQYNVASPQFTDKATMAVHDGAMSCKATESMVHGVECDDAKRSGNDAHYIRQGALGAGQDLHDYDHARVTIATSNIPAGSLNLSIGEVWVTYTVVLRKPKLAPSEAGLLGDLFVANVHDATNQAFGLNDAVLSGYGNSLGGSLTVAPLTLTYVFPEDFSGAVELSLRYEQAIINGAAVTPIAIATLGSGLQYITDMYAASNNGADSPGFGYETGPITSGGGITVVFCRHIFVPPGLTTSQRTVTITYTASAADGIDSWTQANLSISEYWRCPSTKQLAVGPLATRTDEPILVNRAGVVVDL